MKKPVITGLKYKAAAIIATSLSMLSNEVTANTPVKINNPYTRYFTKKKRKPNLVLKLNMFDPANSFYVDHSSHSSHDSHSSHSSHSSGGYDGGSSNDGDSSSENGGSALPGILIVGAVGYGLYRLGKSRKKDDNGQKK